jgi:hypothetical protein
MEKAEPTVPGEEAAFWERKAKNGRRAAGANCLSRHHPVELQVHVYDLNCCGCSSSLCLVSLDLPSHKTSVSASSSSLRQVKEKTRHSPALITNEDETNETGREKTIASHLKKDTYLTRSFAVQRQGNRISSSLD